MSELAADGILVAVTCRVLNLARQPYRWLADPVTDAEYLEACRANALFDAHRDDPEFGYRYLVEEARDAEMSIAERTDWRICSNTGGGAHSASVNAARTAGTGRRSTMILGSTTSPLIRQICCG